MNILILSLLLAASACTTTIDTWSPKDHSSLMRSCNMMCGKERVKSYDSVRGECACSVRSTR